MNNFRVCVHRRKRTASPQELRRRIRRSDFFVLPFFLATVILEKRWYYERS